MKKLTYIFDIDGTIMSQTTPRDYPSAKPYEDMREHINSLYDAGHKIKFFTARGCSSGKDWTEFTKKQLDDFGFKYHELIMNRKPGGDIFIDDLAVNAVEYRKRLNPKRGLLAGAFDVIHPGYIRLFKDAKENACDHLIIALQTDPTLDRPEKIKPAQPWEDRKEILSAIKFVDEVIPYSTEASLLELLKEIKPDVRIIGSDYEGKEFTGSNLGIPNYFHKRNHNYSSTLYKKMIQQSLNKQNGVKKMKILITGALGFIGSHLADKLVNLGYEVFGVDNMMYGKKENVNEKVKYLITDNTNLLNEEIVSQLSGVKTIFHLGAQSRIQPSFADPPGTAHANGLGTAVVCELARTLGARVVYAGSSTANDDVNLNPYAFWKKVGEGTCQMYSKAFGTSTVIARFYNVYETSRNPDIGPYSPVIGLWQRLYLAGKPITITGLGEQKRDFTSVYDVVDGLILLSQKDYSGEIFHFGTGTSYSLREVAEWFGAGGAPLEFIPARPGEAKATLAQADETLERLGWKPERSVKDYVEKFVKNHSFGSNEIDFE